MKSAKYPLLTYEAYERLAELAEDIDPDVRLSALASFFFSKAPRPLAIQTLRKGLQSPLPAIQIMSMNVLAEDYPQAKEALPELEKLKRSKIEQVRETAEGLLDLPK